MPVKVSGEEKKALRDAKRLLREAEKQLGKSIITKQDRQAVKEIMNTVNSIVTKHIFPFD